MLRAYGLPFVVLPKVQLCTAAKRLLPLVVHYVSNSARCPLKLTVTEIAN